MSNEIVDDICVSTVEISTKSGINLTSNDSRLKHTGDGSIIISSTSSLDNAISINTQNGGFIIDSNGKISIKYPETFDTSTPMRVKNKGYRRERIGDMYIKNTVRFKREKKEI